MPPGCGFNPACWADLGVGVAVGGAIQDLADAITQALSQMVTTLSTFWVDMPTSNLTTTDGVTGSPTVSFLQDGLWYWTAALAVVAVIVGGTRMMWEQRGEPVRDLVRSLMTLTLVSGMGLAVIALLIVASDGFSSWIIDQSTDGNGFAPAIQAMIISGEGEVAIFMVIILGLVGIITSVIQIVLMVVRSGMLVILAGILPTTAAFTNTEMGKQWFQKTVGWTLAFILYKPAAAIVYATAFRLIDTDLANANVLLNTITGVALMIVALLALPALLRFVTPVVGAIASGGGGGMAAGALGAAATAAMPSGARSTGAAGRGGGAAAPTPASSSSGGRSSSGGDNGGKSSSSPSGSSLAGSSSTGAKPTAGSGGKGMQGATGTGTPGPSGAPAGGVPAMAGAGVSGAGAGGAGAASGAAAGARVGAVAGPVGAAAGAAISTASKGAQAVKQVSDEAAGDGPSGSNG
jgi:type IV secretion system protein TrbL